ncbi:hypothetical protein GW750_06535 [bacterium]|nr:hypothetical protein [bacterium]
MIDELPRHSDAILLAKMKSLKDDPSKQQEYTNMAWKCPHLWAICEEAKTFNERRKDFSIRMLKNKSGHRNMIYDPKNNENLYCLDTTLERFNKVHKFEN